VLAVSEEALHKPAESIPPTAQRRRFRIELRGQVGKRWMTACEPISFSNSAGITIIEVLADQAGLRGILNRIWDLNLDVYSVVEITAAAVGNGGN
jgi:hypothetical protein